MTIKAGVILVGGGHSSGKKTVCQEIYKELSKLTGERNYISLVDMKDYLFLPIIDNEQTELIKKKNSQMVTPSRFNFKKILGDLSDENSKLYDGVEGRFPIFLVHGLYGLYNKELNEEATMKIFVDGDADTRFVRWSKSILLFLNFQLT